MDVVLLIIEPTHGLTPVHRLFLERFADKTLLVLNQIDRLSPADRSQTIEEFKAQGVSAHTGEGLPELLSAIEQRLVACAPTSRPSDPVPAPSLTIDPQVARLPCKSAKSRSPRAELRELMSVK
jgi:tRNA U34 5-carboxymethylaminomethyl modifying GTPase MnmE/TrmE